MQQAAVIPIHDDRLELTHFFEAVGFGCYGLEVSRSRGALAGFYPPCFKISDPVF
jgi:hypothetical protein